MPPVQTPAALAAATPATRDRYVDLLRGASIVVVVLGHWLMAVATWDRDGVHTGNLLVVVPALQPATWLLQVMPLFFVVGGFANSGSWRSTVRGAGGYADFVHRRLVRLLRPLWVFLAVWLAVAVTLEVAVGTTRTVRVVTLIAVQPLWFVGLYALAVALTPPTLAAHRRHGAAVLVGLAAIVGLVDLMRLGAHLPAVGYVNYAAVWLFAHQLGHFYRDGRLIGLRPATLVPAAGLALVLLVALTTVGPYPPSMVGLPGDRISNMSPPSLCIVVLTGWLTALRCSSGISPPSWWRSPSSTRCTSPRRRRRALPGGRCVPDGCSGCWSFSPRWSRCSGGSSKDGGGWSRRRPGVAAPTPPSRRSASATSCSACAGSH